MSIEERLDRIIEALPDHKHYTVPAVTSEQPTLRERCMVQVAAAMLAAFGVGAPAAIKVSDEWICDRAWEMAGAMVRTIHKRRRESGGTPQNGWLAKTREQYETEATKVVSEEP